jgi:hypothetical protein
LDVLEMEHSMQCDLKVETVFGTYQQGVNALREFLRKLFLSPRVIRGSLRNV